MRRLLERIAQIIRKGVRTKAAPPAAAQASASLLISFVKDWKLSAHSKQRGFVPVVQPGARKRFGNGITNNMGA